MAIKKRLDECCQIELSSIDKKSKVGETPVKLCNFTDVYYNWNIYPSMVDIFMDATASEKNISIFSLKKGDVVITKDSETRDDIGMAALVFDDLPDTVLGYHCALIRPNEELDGGYLNAYLNSKIGRKHFENQASGSGQRYTLTKEALGSIVIPIIDIDIQRKIGSIFNTIDIKIKNNNSICANLENMAKLLYDYWFVQFDFPDENGKPYKSSGGKMVWNDELKREIPEGWEVGNLYNIADFINGLACQKFRPHDDSHKLPVIKIGEMHNGFGADVEWARDNVPSKNIINDGDILFSWSASLEVMLWNKGKGVLNQHIFNVIPKGYDKYYVYQQLSRYVVNFVKMAESRKTTMGHITTDHLKQSRIVLPPLDLVTNYGSAVYSIFENVLLCSSANQQLASLRDFLLPMLMNGQVKIKG